jgi:hypothetical protein
MITLHREYDYQPNTTPDYSGLTEAELNVKTISVEQSDSDC